MNNRNGLGILTVILLLFTFLKGNAQQEQKASKAWVEKSNTYTRIFNDIQKKYSPEFGSEQGLAFYDTLIGVPTLASEKAQRMETEAAVAKLKVARQSEADHLLKQDLDILIKQAELGFKNEDFALSKTVPFMNATAAVFGGLQSLLDEQTEPARHPAAIIRLNKYAGLEAGYEPLTAIFKRRVEQQMAKPGVIYPAKQSMEIALSRNGSMLAGIAELFKKYNLVGWEASYATIKKQLEEYDDWVKATILPNARTDFRLPPEAYKLSLEAFGIDIPPAELASKAHAAYIDIQNQMKPIAEQVAKKYKLPSSDYRDVIRFLKKEQIVGDSIMIVYKSKLALIEDIIRKHELVTLPERAAIIRLASEAESVQQPAPHMVPPPFLNNTGQRGVFVLPLNIPAAPGAKVDKYDDFTFDAASWTIIAHEARPGHELQFAKMVEEAACYFWSPL